jgi:hypothetical protein
MDRLRGEFTIGMNRLHLLELGWDPDWWILSDVSNADEWDWPFMAARESFMFVRAHERELIEPYRSGNIAYFDSCGHGNRNLPNGWHLPEPCRYGGGITMALQIAAELGRNPIYLLGCDLYKYRGPGDDINHFHPGYSRYKIRKSTGEEVNPPEAYPRLNAMLIKAHTIARDSAARMGITIYNATVGGALGVYERADIWDVLDGK